jgi:hypothetical protein
MTNHFLAAFSIVYLLRVFSVPHSPMKMANSSRRVSCGLDFCSVPDIRGSLQGASEAGYASFLLFLFSHLNVSLRIYDFENGENIFLRCFLLYWITVWMFSYSFN